MERFTKSMIEVEVSAGVAAGGEAQKRTINIVPWNAQGVGVAGGPKRENFAGGRQYAPPSIC